MFRPDPFHESERERRYARIRADWTAGHVAFCDLPRDHEGFCGVAARPLIPAPRRIDGRGR